VPTTLILSRTFIAYEAAGERRRERGGSEGGNGQKEKEREERERETIFPPLARAPWTSFRSVANSTDIRSNYSAGETAPILPPPHPRRLASRLLPLLSSSRFFLPFRPLLFRRLMIIVNPPSQTEPSVPGNIPLAILYDNHFRRESSAIRRIDVGRGREGWSEEDCRWMSLTNYSRARQMVACTRREY